MENSLAGESFAKFLSPGSEFHPAVYWFWHHIPTQEEIETQLEGIKQSGFRTFLIQARLALPIEQFLSEEYLDAYLSAMKVAKRLGLTAGLYDDYNWLSGHGGGRTVRGHNHLRERHLFWSTSQVDDRVLSCALSGVRSLLVETLEEPGMQWCYEGGIIQWGEWQIFRALAYPDEGSLTVEEVIDITEHCELESTSSDGCVVRISLPAYIPAGWKVTTFIAARCLSSRSINYLLPEATQRFLEVAYEPFARKMGEYLGDTLSFAFFDHPHAAFYAWDQLEGNILNSLLYDEGLVSAFEQEHGYPMEWALLSFIHQLGNMTPKYRCDFFDTYSRLAIESFFGQIARWTQAHDMGLAGHELLGYIGKWGFVGGFERVDHRSDFGGDYFSIDSYRTITTVDAYNNLPQINARMGDSLARSHGRRGCLIEQYYFATAAGMPGYVGQWDLTLNDYRAQAIRHHILGARQFLYHGYYLSDGEDGDFTLFKNPRFDFPPGINYEPWIPFHSDFAVEMARLSAFINSGDTPTNLAVLYPLRTYWAEGAQHSFAQESAFWNQWLVNQGINFDFIDEDQILNAQFSQGELRTEFRSYRGLILTGVSTLYSANTLEKILSFAGEGGIIIASGQLPKGTQVSGLDSGLEDKFRLMFEEHENTIYFADNHDFGEVQAKVSKLLNRSNLKSLAVNFLQDPGHEVWSWLGANLSGDLVVLFNDSMKRKELTFSIPDPTVSPERWDPLLGTRTTWAWLNRDEASTSVHVLLEPEELTCLAFKSSGQAKLPYLYESSLPVLQASNQDGNLNIQLEAERGQEGATALVCSQREPMIASENVAGQVSSVGEDQWQIQLQLPTLPQPLDLDEGWSFYTEKHPSRREIDIQQGWEQQGFADFSGMGCYECVFILPKEYLSCDLDLVFKQIVTSAEIYINGELIGRRGWPPYRLSIPKSKIAPGKNHLMVNVYNTGGNRYYQNTPFAGSAPTPSGIIGAPRFQPLHRINVSL